MSENIPFSSQPKKAFHQRNASDELDVFEAARYFSGASENFTDTHKNVNDGSRNYSMTTQKHCMRPFGRMSLDMPKGNPDIPLQAMLLENPNKETKKSKLPSSPGGKLAHFLNSLFNQTSSKKSKSKTKSTKDEDASPNGWRRKRRSSMSHFRSSNTPTTTTTTTTNIMHDSKSLFSTSSSSGYRTPPTYQVAHTPIKTTSYRDHFKSYSSYLKPPPSQITKTPVNGNFNGNHKCNFIETNTTFENGFVEKVKMFDEKQEDHYQPHNNNKYILNKDIQEFKRFIDEDDGGESDSSSDLFELSNCDLGRYCSSGLPVYETTHMDSIKRGAPISS